MEAWQALVLGLVEGLTEFLPVSSTGHLLVAQRLLGLPEGEAANAYAVVIQAGAILAVLALYRRRVQSMFAGALGRDDAGRRLATAVVLAFLPAAAAGLALDDWIEARLFGPWPVVLAWIVGGALILVLERRQLASRRPRLELADIGPRLALLVGLAQCAALWPGTSRSLATILGGLAAGLSLAAAVEFSFLLGVVTLLAASAYKALDAHAILLESYGLGTLALGLVAACVSALVAVRWMIAWLSRRGLALFGWYRVALGFAVAAWLVWQERA